MFVLSGDYVSDGAMDIEALINANTRYKKYLLENKDKFPENAFQIATAKWRTDRNDKRAFSDSWLDSLTIRELSTGSCSAIKKNQITIRLLGAYQDGYTELTYSGVHSYQLGKLDCQDGHGDLLRDEIRLSSREIVIHEIEWSRNERWVIECDDIKHEWLVKVKKTTPRAPG